MCEDQESEVIPNRFLKVNSIYIKPFKTQDNNKNKKGTRKKSDITLKFY